MKDIIIQLGFSDLSTVSNNILLKATESNRKIIIVSGSIEESKKISVDIKEKFAYNARILKEEVLSFKDFEFYQERVIIITKETFVKLFTNKKNLAIVSSCRYGLSDTYAPLLLSMNTTGAIVSFDNDEKIALKAQEILKNTFRVEKGVAHATVSNVDKDSDPTRIKVTADNYGARLYFPPGYNKYFHLYNIPEVYFAKSHKQLEDIIRAKAVYVNGLHSITVLTALDKIGFKKENLSLSICSLPSRTQLEIKIEVYNTIKKIWDNNRNSFNTFSSLDINNWEEKSIIFVDSILNSENEKLERGLKFDSRSLEKINMHEKYLSDCFDFKRFKQYFK